MFEDEENSSFEENTVTPSCAPDAQRVVASKFDSGNFHTFISLCAPDEDGGG